MTDHPTPPALTAAQMERVTLLLALIAKHGVGTDGTGQLHISGPRDETYEHYDYESFVAEDAESFAKALTTAQSRIEALEGELRDWSRRHCEPRISTRCPSCGHDTLFIAKGGHLTCSWLECGSPGLARYIEQAVSDLTGARTRAEGLEALVVDIALHVKHLPDWAELRITEALTPAKEEADNTAALRRENVTLREALTFARQHIHDGDALHSCGMDAEDGSYNDGCGPDACWACLTNTALARIDRALTPPPATTGQEPPR